MTTVAQLPYVNREKGISMIDLTGVEHHPVIEEIVDVLCNKTQNTDRGFFRVEVAYFLGKMASCMRANISTKDRGDIPVSVYSLALATSGYGKGYSVSTMENNFIQGFKKRFMEETLPVISEAHLWDLANEKAARNISDAQTEFDTLTTEFRRLGAYAFTFDSGTVPAVKQLRQKLLLANSGSINLQIDEIGSNLIGSTELLTLFLELYDQGQVKQKLTKNTNENQRSEEMDGKTPANMLLFGTPSKLLDGGQAEDHFYSFLEIGYARRCIFGIGHQDRKSFHTMSAAEIYQKLIQPNNNTLIRKWSTHFHKLADPSMFGWTMKVEDDVAIKLIEYKINCEQAADNLPDHEEIKKSELSHRYFKALKIAGAYAFVDESLEVTMDHLLSAIKLVEESGESFQAILNREKAYVKLAKYIANVGSEVTHADLHEALPFYKSSAAARKEMMTMAIAWGYKQHILIKNTYRDGIDFYRGETLKETNLDEMKVSYSDHFAYNYKNETAPFDQLHMMTQANGIHWINHHVRNEHRSEESVVPGFNMIVLDIDEGVSLKQAQELMSEYVYMTYTTKSHTDDHNRFRLILPINYNLELETDEYKEFMSNVLDWLPFPVDDASRQRSKKWESYDKGTYHINKDGKLLDALKFIPQTSKNEAYRKSLQQIESMDNLERWFAQQISVGNRNKQMIKYALALVDTGLSLKEVEDRVFAFNNKLSNPLPDDEIRTTILVTVAKRYNP